MQTLGVNFSEQLTYLQKPAPVQFSRTMPDRYHALMDREFHLSNQAGFFDGLPLECDGLTQVASAVLDRDGISHQAMCGRLTVAGVGTIPMHFWIEMPSGEILDFRARMWLGNDARVPHGLFLPESGTCYESRQVRHFAPDAIVFMVLAGQAIADTPELLVPNTASHL